ncbi:MAG: Gfo/Idh/MocA family oxidoreductase [Chitinophagaceae bacterium]|nr:Gfo/Idh/MocA family oxidoreductase [Chitinophagaceae bacterium]
MIHTFAIIGCGRIAERHAEHIARLGTLKAVCDTEQERANQLGVKYKSAVYYNIDDLLQNEKVDVVAICTPNGLHAEHSIKALEAGMHVLCEKPMAIRSEDCRKMITASEKSVKNLFIVKQNRFNPPVQAVKQLIDRGILGRIYSIQLNCFWNRDVDYYNESPWKGTLKLDGGILFTQFSHFIDLLYWMVGDVTEVKGFRSNSAHERIVEFEDSGVAVLRFKNGAVGTINYTVNSYNKNMEGSFTIFAENGTVKIGGQYLNELEYQDIKSYIIPPIPSSNRANNYGQYEGSMSNHDKVYDSLIGTLEKGRAYITTSFEAMKTVEIIEQIYRSGDFVK